MVIMFAWRAAIESGKSAQPQTWRDTLSPWTPRSSSATPIRAASFASSRATGASPPVGRLAQARFWPCLRRSRSFSWRSEPVEFPCFTRTPTVCAPTLLRFAGAKSIFLRYRASSAMEPVCRCTGCCCVGRVGKSLLPPTVQAPPPASIGRRNLRCSRPSRLPTPSRCIGGWAATPNGPRLR